MTDLKALLFDVDGTLADTEHHGHRVAFNRAFSETDFDWHWSEQQYAELLEITGGLERIKQFLQSRLGASESAAAIDQLASRLHQRKNHFYRAILQSGELPLRPGIRRLVTEALEEGIALGIVSTSGRENIDILVRQGFGVDAEKLFQVIVSGESVREKKPAPEGYLTALDKLGLQADQCMAIEDSDAGLNAAHQAGISVLITTNRYTRGQDFSRAAAVVSHLGEPNDPTRITTGLDPSITQIDMSVLRRLHLGN